MAAKTFTNTLGGTWDVGSNWTPAGVPGASDNAFINNPGIYTVTLDNTQGPNSITLNDATATLNVTASGIILANTVVLDAGTVALAGDVIGSTITSAGALFQPSGATLDGVTWMGQLVGAGITAGWNLQVKDGITLLDTAGTGPGTLEFGSLYVVNIADATTLDNFTIQFDTDNAEYLNGSATLPLIFGPNLVVQETTAANSGAEISGAELINFGSINAASAAGALFIASSTFENNGTLTATSGDHVTVSSNFTNTHAGTVNVTAAATLTIGSTGTPTNDSTIAVATAGSLVVSGDMGGTGQVTLATHAVADVHNLGGSVIFEDNKGTLDLESPSTFTTILGGFQKGDTIDLLRQATTGKSFSGDTSSGTLTVKDGAATVASLIFGGNYTTETFTLGPDGGTGTDVTVACLAEGTRILTSDGEVAVEALRVGDLLPVLLGRQVARVRWIGHRRIDCARHPRPAEVWPVRVLAGAFGAAAPHRDLWFSPDHAVLVDDALVPIRYLVNGASIAQVETPEVTYWHVELDRHEILLAEGVAAESYLDTGNRGAFGNAGAVVQAHADFALRVWEEKSCAPLVVAGPTLTAARERLLARAQVLGFGLTTEPEARLIVDGQTVRPDLDGATYRFLLPDGAREVRLVSRSVVPAQVLADSTDRRRVGIAVARMLVDGAEVSAGDPRRTGGWHAAEAAWQWTDGDAGLACAGARLLEITVVALLPYWDSDAAGARLAAR